MLTDSRATAIDPVNSAQAGGMLTDYPIYMSTLKNYPLFVNWTEDFLMRMEALGALDEIGKRWFGEYAEAMQAE